MQKANTLHGTSVNVHFFDVQSKLFDAVYVPKLQVSAQLDTQNLEVTHMEAKASLI